MFTIAITRLFHIPCLSPPKGLNMGGLLVALLFSFLVSAGEVGAETLTVKGDDGLSASYVTQFAGQLESLKTKTTSTHMGRRASINPDDLQPFVNTSWQFTYTITNTFTNTISCGSNIVTKELAMLVCADEHDNTVSIAYDSEIGYFISVGNILEDTYVVTLDGCCSAKGVYYAHALDDNWEHPYPLTGIRIESTSPQAPTNSGDLQPFVNTSWQFTYTLTNTFTNTISCGSNIVTKESAWLVCADEHDNTVSIAYNPEIGYFISVENILEDIYVVTLDGCCSAKGVYYAHALDDNWEHPYPLTGTRINPPSESTSSNPSSEPASSIVLLPLGPSQATDATGQPITTSTVMEGGNSVNGKPPEKQVTQKLSDTVDIKGNITVDPADVGQPVDIFVYAVATFPGSDVVMYFMLGPGLTISAWDQNPASLVAFTNATLGSVQTVPMYSGTFFYPGTLKVFFGYRLANGTLVKNTQPIDITIDDDSAAAVSTSNNEFASTFKRVEYYKPAGYCAADMILVWLLFEATGVNTSDLLYVEEKSVYQTDPANPHIESLQAFNSEGFIVRESCALSSLKSDFQVRLKEGSTGRLSNVMVFTVDVNSAVIDKEAPPLTATPVETKPKQ